MNFRFTATLFGIILVAVVVLLIRAFLTESPVEGSLVPNLVGIKADQIDSVEIERQNPPGILKLERRGKDSWMIVEPIKAKAEASLVTATINAVLRAKPTTFPERVQNLSVAGLQPPSLKVTLRQGNERSGTLNIGMSVGGTVYVSTLARPDRPIAVTRADLDSLFRDSLSKKDAPAGDLTKWTVDYRVKSVFPSDPRSGGDDVTALKLSLPNKKKELALSRTPSGWKFDVPAGWGEADPVGDLSATPNTFSGVRPLIGALTSLQALTPEDFVDEPKDLKEYGLNPDNPDLLRVEIQTRENGTAVVYLGKREGAILPSASGPGLTSKIWVRIEGQQGVIRANAGDLSGLIPVIENPDPLRDRTLLGAEKSMIDGIDLVVGGQTTKLRLAGVWKLFGNTEAGDPQIAGGPAMKKILEVLTERRTIKSFPAANPANFTPPEIKCEVKVWVKGFETPTDPKAEPKELSKPTILLFGKKEGDTVHVRRTLPDGTVGEFQVSDKIKVENTAIATPQETTTDLIPELAKTRLDFLDTSLKTYSPFLVNKVTVTGAKNYELDKEEKKLPSFARDRWIFASPADQKGKTADANTVAEMLQQLGTMSSVTRFVDETPTPEKLKEYGLSPAPRLKIVIGLKGTDPADKERIYEFGAITGENVYARQPGKNAVFTLPKAVYDKFVDADLRDRAIFQFDPTQITAIEFKGWKGAAGFVTELNFEKNKEGVWTTTKSPGPYAVDPKKLDAFLTMLSVTSVKSFLPGAPTPEQGFSDDKVALTIVLKPTSGPPITLTLGNPADMGASYYGMSSNLPQTAPVFTVDATRFKIYKENSGVFAK